jgi:hypothetical protein
VDDDALNQPRQGRTIIAHGFNRGLNGQSEMSPGGTAENRAGNFQPDFLSPLRGLICFWNAYPQLKLRAIFCRLCEAEKQQQPV